MFCREQVVQLHRERESIRRAGAELVVIGNGAPHFIAGFREITGYDGPLYTDPSLASLAVPSSCRLSKMPFGPGPQLPAGHSPSL